MLENKFIPLMILVSLAMGLTLAGCDGEESKAKAVEHERVVKVETVTVTPIPLKDILTLPGETEPDEDVSVSSDSAGTVKWLGVHEGDRVEKGAIVARVDVASSGARLDQAKASRELAAEQLRRRRELLEKGVLAQEEFDEMAAKLEESDASLREMQVSVDNGVIRAPVSGIVNKLHVDQGERLSEGSPVVDIVDPTLIRVTINVPEMDIPYIKKDQKVTVTVDAIPGRTWDGVVEFISFKADATSKTFETRVLTDNLDGAIRAGMLARVSLERRTIEDAVTAPLYAVINQGGERLLYVNENGTARARTIEIGVVSDDLVQVTRGLKAGDELIVSGHTMVEDGTRVETK
ncbi:efflux RND transporter periplasmic adaptor subunit [Pseudodesulfovibrio portus]|uniref:MexH family multidrug efflux RND transporter periplasmic adaptor subunit n=1 Tax=Pseudodesulfovibrio portus TaxID=231439 RepID=A0ABM8AQY5_9BACT|nr:efflux RND transporter periplasmic adaptor subunit [Pseudodesulfovibrio portus]BDQ33834.1 MexH family multidrug efflux RND transporter periplasmic adaptor subunit [Pseudodesulfovibrio portus]